MVIYPKHSDDSYYLALIYSVYFLSERGWDTSIIGVLGTWGWSEITHDAVLREIPADVLRESSGVWDQTDGIYVQGKQLSTCTISFIYCRYSNLLTWIFGERLRE